MFAALAIAAAVSASSALPALPASPAAASHAPAPGEAGPFSPAYRSGCVRSLREFAWELSSAVEVGDVNRLAALYRWRGTPTRAGYATMARLQTIASRPLLEVVPVYAQADPDPGLGGGVDEGLAAVDPAGPADAQLAAIDPAVLSGPYDFVAVRHGPPVALRLHQTLADGTTRASTTLWLRRDLGCWWVTL